MAEWHVTPDYIVNNWTDELFNLMLEKLVERKTHETEAINKPTQSIQGNDRIVSDTELFGQLGSKLKVVKKS